MLSAVDLGLIFGVMALGVYLTYRLLDFPDLTVDGSYTTGAAVCATMIVGGQPPLLATIAGGLTGICAGFITGVLSTKGKINPLLAGILTQIALYSINLRIMGKANVPLLRADTLLSGMRDEGLFGSWASIGVFAALAVATALFLDWFLTTDLGLAMRATGDNEEMARSQGVPTDNMKIMGVALSNGLVALCGAIVAQYQGFADIGMGIGLIVAGLASVIIGQAFLPSRAVWIATIGAVVGSIIYRVVIQLALQAGFNPNDMKLISAVLVVIALLLPRWSVLRRIRGRLRMRQLIADRGLAEAEGPALEEVERKHA